jgi:hypothetical protein
MANPYITQADPMMSQTLIDPEAQALQRQKQYAAALMQQNQQPQGQMIGGRFVAPSFTQQLNSALNPVLGAYMLNKADTEQLGLAERLRQQGEKDIQAYGQAITGTGISTGTYIKFQNSGTTGGAGTYTLSAVPTTVSPTITGYTASTVLTVVSLSTGTLLVSNDAGRIGRASRPPAW